MWRRLWIRYGYFWLDLVISEFDLFENLFVTNKRSLLSVLGFTKDFTVLLDSY